MNDPTELHEAASLGNKRLLQTLLVEGHYDVDSEDWTYERKTPLHVAVERGQLNCVKLLLFHGADPASRTRSGLTPAHFAAESGDIKCLQALMAYDAPIDLEDDSGTTPLDLARTYSQKRCCRFLEKAIEILQQKENYEYALNILNEEFADRKVSKS
eukprot:Seg1028.2 transcript_id=Seg1028.2/GoldUCD/mRNA.D3Y31 product="Ankyrin repeat domain-containing protein 66" protein_id=Seg1028.2/GoldUCD/D3Y31